MILKIQQKKLKLAVLFFLNMGLSALQAQETIVASGSDAYGHGGSVSYSVGQIVYSTYVGASYSEAQGVQQPYEISIETDFEGPYNISLTCSAYPNPVVDILTLQIPDYIDENITYTLTDINGQILSSGQVKLKETLISMSEYAAATYYLKVVQEKNGSVPRKTKVFKIIQNKR